MEPYLAYSELTKIVYIVYGKKKIAVPDWLFKQIAEQKLNLKKAKIK